MFVTSQLQITPLGEQMRPVTPHGFVETSPSPDPARTGRIEEKIDSEPRFRSLGENANASVAATDSNGRLTYINNALASPWDHSIDEMLDQPWKDFLHPDDQDNVLALA